LHKSHAPPATGHPAPDAAEIHFDSRSPDRKAAEYELNRDRQPGKKSDDDGVVEWVAAVMSRIWLPEVGGA
jgi:hypothetical protein